LANEFEQIKMGNTRVDLRKGAKIDYGAWKGIKVGFTI
jgi:hypothetical protein